jgi:hypothetical protein
MNNHKAVTEKVLEANRMNAKQSTGPKSAGGKLAVRYNAVKHGLLAKQILFRHDKVRQEEFNDFLDELECDLIPVGPIERMLVEEIGACWCKTARSDQIGIQGISKPAERFEAGHCRVKRSRCGSQSLCQRVEQWHPTNVGLRKAGGAAQ